MDNERIANSMLEVTHKTRQVAVETQGQLRSRYVWLAGISGFILVNVDKYFALLGLTNLHVGWLLSFTVPFAVGAFLAIFTIFKLEEMGTADDLYYVAKISAMSSFMVISAATANVAEMLKFIDIDNNDAEIIKATERVHKLQKSATRWENASLYVIMSAFAWLVIGTVFISLACI